MTQPPHFLDDLAWRGLIAVSTDLGALRAALDEGPITLYCGFDPTAPSLHLGNLVQILTLRRFQDAGHRPLALVGGATGLIGDPKENSERQLNDPETVADWVEKIKRQVGPFLDFGGGQAAQPAVTVNNLDWTASLSAIDLLRNIGKHFRVNKMLAKEAVSARLNSDVGISYTEFSYQILQGLDFLELYRRHGCTLQTGGSDQWGNLTAGLDLIHRVEGASAHALATPLITKADGTKFGKTESGTIWLEAEMTSPYAFYQFWINSDDRDVVGYLKIFSLRPREEIEELEAAVSQRPAAREAQRALAEELTTLVHGADECARAVAASAALFGRGELADLDEATLAAALSETGVVAIAADPLPAVLDVLIATELVDSRSAARRAVVEGGVYINNTKVTDPDAALQTADLLHGRWVVIRRGKRSVVGARADR
ncbi:MAG TPA: tyrosine--tRNA ligase [Acidothermaceae bacterium]